MRISISIQSYDNPQTSNTSLPFAQLHPNEAQQYASTKPSHILDSNPSILTHSPSYTEIADSPLKIYVPPQETTSDPLDDAWAAAHKEDGTSNGDPADKEAYHKALNCPNVCADATAAAPVQTICPDFKTMLQNVAHAECEKCPFDVSRCPGGINDIDPHHHLDDAEKPAQSAATSIPSPADQEVKKPKNKRALISYVYTEDTPSAKTNFEFFTKHALHDEADFIFILYGNSTVDSDILPVGHPNINIFRQPLSSLSNITQNFCSPLAPHLEILNSTTGGATPLKEKYEKFIFLDSTMRGPFIPRWSAACWSSSLLAMLKGNTKMVGTELACLKDQRPYLQPHFLGVDRDGLEVLLTDTRFTYEGRKAQLAKVKDKGNYTETAAPAPTATAKDETKQQARAVEEEEAGACRKQDAEKSLTYAIRDQNWDAAVLEIAWQDARVYRYLICSEDNERYVGVNSRPEGQVDPWEVLFVDPDIMGEGVEDLTFRFERGGYSSFDACRFVERGRENAST